MPTRLYNLDIRAPPAPFVFNRTYKNETEETIMYANFMKHSFKNYFAPDGKGGYKEVKRGECFAYDADSFTGKYPQQWYWDAENGFAIRLERNEAGKKIYNEARTERRRALKAHLEQFGYVCKECLDCKGWNEDIGGESKCDTCVKHVIFISLDEEHESGDGEKAVRFDVESETDSDPEHQTIKNELLETLHAVLRTLGADEQALWRFLVANTRKKVIAAHFGWTLKQLEYRELKLYIKLRSNQALRSFFEK
jgi:hypothetical protein